MDIYLLIASTVILLVAVLLFVKKPKAADGISVAELSRLKNENTSLNIALAKAEERARNLALERDKAEKQLQDERVRYDHQTMALNQELVAEKSHIAKVEEQFIAQHQRFADQEKSIHEIQQKFQLEFQNVANKLLDEKSRNFVETNRTHPIFY